ncbi:hypothetical protein BDQ17DRAFT_1247232, partial [Cyathus striatus]
HDVWLHDVKDTCGLYLSLTNGCIIHLFNKGKKSQISMEKSKCPNLHKFQLKQAAKYTDRSPCTNHPIQCELYPPDVPAIWKYNLWSHILLVHPTATIQHYRRAYDISEHEVTLMKAVYLSKPHISRKKKSQIENLMISEGHSMRMLLH